MIYFIQAYEDDYENDEYEQFDGNGTLKSTVVKDSENHVNPVESDPPYNNDGYEDDDDWS